MKQGWFKEKFFDLVVMMLVTGVTVYIALNTRVVVVEQKVMAQGEATQARDAELTEWLKRVESKLDTYIFNTYGDT